MELTVWQEKEKEEERDDSAGCPRNAASVCADVLYASLSAQLSL